MDAIPAKGNENPTEATGPKAPVRFRRRSFAARILLLLTGGGGVRGWAAGKGKVAAGSWVGPVWHEGMAGASAIEGLGQGPEFVVADDEDNRLRLYRWDRGGSPLAEWDSGSWLRDPARAGQEMDLEASARWNDWIFWAGSHARNSRGELRPGRHLLLATRFWRDGGRWRAEPVGQPCRDLMKSILQCPWARTHGLDRAGRLPPDRGGLNVEGMAAGTEGHLWVGFRGPLVAGMALVVPLLNASEVPFGAESRIGDPEFLDLKGHGIRAMASSDGGIHLLSGPVTGGPGSALHFWPGRGHPPVLRERFSETGRRLEGLTRTGGRPGFPEEGRWVMASDDRSSGKSVTPLRFRSWNRPEF